MDGRDKLGHDDAGQAGKPHFGWAAIAIVALAFIAFASDSAHAQSGPKFPALTGRVVDNANLIPPEDEARLVGDLEALEQKNTTQLVVATVPALQGYEIEDYGYRLGREWGIGQAGKDNGVILLVAPNERKVRIEVGRGLEPILTDGLTRLIIENAILPLFRKGDFAAGINTGAADLIKILSGEGAEVQERLGAQQQKQEAFSWIPILFWVAIILFIMWLQWRASKDPARFGRDRGGGSGPIFVPGGWSGSGGGWGGGGGGGFGGGGGGFGGGGSSGGW